MASTHHFIRTPTSYALLLVGLCHATADGKGHIDPQQCSASECDAPSMLQVKGNVVHGRAASKGAEGKAAAAPLPRGTVNWDGFTSVEVQWQEISGFAAELFFRVSSDQVGPRNSTHVFFPFGQMMTATFVRDIHAIGSYEYGFARWVWNPNVISAMGPGVAVGTAEKLHTFTHEGAWSTESLDRVRLEQASRSSTTDSIARYLRWSRSAAVNTWANMNKVGAQLINASIDPAVMADLTAYASETNPSASDAFESRMDAVGANLTQKHEAHKQHLATNGGSPSPTGTAVNCFHLHESPGLQQTPEGFWWPLGRKLVALRGQVVLAPLQHFGVVTGTTMARFNETDGSIEIYMGAASISDLVDPTVPSLDPRHQQKLYVGPADGANRPIPADDRHQPVPLSARGAALIWGVYNTFQMIPADYTYLYEPLGKVCPDAEMEVVKSELLGLDLMAALNGDTSSWDLHEMVLGQASSDSKANAMRIITNTIDCATDYLVTSIPNSHAYGAFEALVFVHGIVEFSVGVTQRGWNVIPEEMFCPDSGCTAVATTTTTATESSS